MDKLLILLYGLYIMYECFVIKNYNVYIFFFRMNYDFKKTTVSFNYNQPPAIINRM